MGEQTLLTLHHLPEPRTKTCLFLSFHIMDDIHIWVVETTDAHDIFICPMVFAEAGGEVSDAAGNPLDFSKGRYLDLETGIIVTNKKLMPSLLKAVRECLDEKPSSL